MPTVYKGYATPATGTLSGVWGTTINEEMMEVIDRNLGGVVEKSLSSSNVVLTSEESEYLIVRLTGTLTANVQVTTAAQGMTIIENLTSGAFDVTLTDGVASAVTLAQGLRSLVLTDSTNGARLFAAAPADNSVNTAQIVDEAVTYAKIQDISATSRVLGRRTSGAGVTEECTLSQVLDFIGSAAQGDILYRGGSAWARLGAGTAKRFLQTQGAGANPQWAAVITPATVQATTSGTTKDFTGIPAGVNRITVNLQGVSLNGSENILIQIGDSGGFESSGYSSSSGTISSGGGVGGANSTSGFVISVSGSTRAASGSFTITRLTGNWWTFSGSANLDTNLTCFSGGAKELSAELDRVRVTESGFDSFDAGQVNIFYE